MVTESNDTSEHDVKRINFYVYFEGNIDRIF